MSHLFVTIFVTATTFIAMVAGSAEATAQGNRFAKLNRDADDSYVAGTILKIQRDPPKCLLRIDEVLVGDGKKLGKTIDIRSLIDTNSTPATLSPFLPSVDYPFAPDDGLVKEGSRFVIFLVGESSTPGTPYPLRLVDRFHAVAEFRLIREKLSSEKPSPQALAECKTKILDDLHKMAKIPFWSEYREGAVLHPRVEEMCDTLIDLESKTGEKIIDTLIGDSEEDIHLRAALIAFLEARDFDGSTGMRRYTDFSRASTPLIVELRTRPKTSQDACALIVLMHAIYRNKREQESPLPHAGEVIREALDPSNPSEYRLAFVKRFMYGWQEPHQTRRFDAMMTLLETEACDPDPKAKYPPPDTVGDWLIHHMLMAQATGSIKTSGEDGYDLVRLHPSARKRLGWNSSGANPNRLLPPKR